MTETARPQINASKLIVGGGIVGAIFTIGSMLIFLTGLPILRFLFPVAFLLGCLFALLRRLRRPRTPGAPWLLAATRDVPELPTAPSREHDSEHPTKILRIPGVQPRLLWLGTNN
jgi:hypothetical protein